MSALSKTSRHSPKQAATASKPTPQDVGGGVGGGGEPLGFEQESLAVLQRLRTALLRLIESLPERPQRAADIERALGLSTKLAWQIHRVANSTNPLSAAEQVPGGPGIRQVLKAAMKQGLPRERINAVADAMEGFEEFVRHHAGDRGTFARMASSMAEGGDELLDLALRRSAFRDASLIWGTQVKAMLWCGFLHPGSHNEVFSGGALFGVEEWKRFRPVVTPRKMATRIGNQSDVEGEKPAIRRLGPVLLEEFSTQPLPTIDRKMGDEGWEEITLMPATLGNGGATSFYLMEGFIDDSWKSKSEEEPKGIIQVECTSPSEVLILDALVYDGMFGTIAPQAAVFDGRWPASGDELLERTRLPMRPAVELIGRGPEALHTADVVRYPEMFEEVCKRMGWEASKFDVWRCRVEYPIMSSIAAIWFPLPEKGNW